MMTPHTSGKMSIRLAAHLTGSFISTRANRQPALAVYRRGSDSQTHHA